MTGTSLRVTGSSPAGLITRASTAKKKIIFNTFLEWLRRFSEWLRGNFRVVAPIFRVVARKYRVDVCLACCNYATAYVK